MTAPLFYVNDYFCFTLLVTCVDFHDFAKVFTREVICEILIRNIDKWSKFG